MCVQGMVLDLDAGRSDSHVAALGFRRLPQWKLAPFCWFFAFRKKGLFAEHAFCFACMCSLTVWLNGVRRGVMVPSGLVGPLRWAVDLNKASVRIDGPKPPLS